MSTVEVTTLKHESAVVDNITLSSDGTSTLAGNLVFSDASVQTTAGDLTATELNVTGSAPMYACRAWVNFNGIGTVAIRASGNVSSITDNGTGDYTVNFTTAMQDVNYSASTSAAYITTGASAMIRQSSVITPFLTTSVRINTGYSYPSGYSMQDTAAGQLTIFR